MHDTVWEGEQSSMTYISKYDHALAALLGLPVNQIKEVADRCDRTGRNHRRRCEALARYLEYNHDRAIAKAPDESWLPVDFQVCLEDWITVNIRG